LRLFKFLLQVNFVLRLKPLKMCFIHYRNECLWSYFWIQKLFLENLFKNFFFFIFQN